MDDHPAPSERPAPEPAPEPAVDPAAEPSLTPRGRAARLQAEDAADAAAHTQRWRGFGERAATDAPETPETVEPQTEAAAAEIAESSSAPAPRRRLGMMAAIVVLALVGAGVYAVPKIAQRLRPQQAATVAPTPAPQAPQTQAPPAAPVQPTPAPAAAPPAPTPAVVPAQTAAAPPTPAPEPVGAANTSPQVADGTQAQQMAALQARIATLEAALGNSAKLDELAKRVAVVESKSADAGTVLALSERVRTLETSARDAAAEQTARVGLLLAIAQWREAVNGGRPYQLELDSVKVLSVKAAVPLALDAPAVAAHARAGIATLDALRIRFDENAGRVLRATAVPNGVGDWLARAFDRLFAVVTIRRVDGLVEGNTPSAILARAGAYLRDGNLAAAVTEMEGLSGAPAEAAKPWLDEARARVATESAAADATSKTLAVLGSAARPALERPSEKAEP